MASSPSSDCLLRIAMTHKKVVHLPTSAQQAASMAAGNMLKDTATMIFAHGALPGADSIRSCTLCSSSRLSVSELH